MSRIQRQAAFAVCLCYFLRGMMRFFVALMIAFSIAATLAFSQSSPPDVRACGTYLSGMTAKVADDVGGRHITARGTLRILLVFASFPDDSTPNPYWPVRQSPLSMTGFLDPDTLTASAGSFNLTNYFRQMSLGQFHLIGDAIWVESHHSKTEYANGAYGRANTDVLVGQVDSLIDFRLYDAWTNSADYTNSNEPDGLVDMIVMVWRTAQFPYIGEASLGRKPTIILDGVRIGMGFPEDLQNPVGSGITCEYRSVDTPEKVMRTIAHELGHWLLGGPHPYNGDVIGDKHSYWGILCDGNRLASCMNSYEREQLGWITIPIVQSDSSYILPDYLASGVSLKYHPANGSPLEYFYFENHQRHSVFDDVSLNQDDKGLWILHQQGPYQDMDNLRIEPSDGRWSWVDHGLAGSCFGQTLPLFEKGEPAVRTGRSHRDMIPTQVTEANWLTSLRTFGDTIECGQFFAGEGFTGAFDTTGNAVFSPYSNPSSNTWDGSADGLTIDVLRNDSGNLTLHASEGSNESPPAKRYLGVNPATGVLQGNAVQLAWGMQWADGQALEPGVSAAELQRRVRPGDPWVTLYEGASMQWTDSTMLFDSAGANTVSYRTRVKSAAGTPSLWSNILFLRVASTPSGLPHVVAHGPVGFALLPGFPNPFNGRTTIRFTIPERAMVNLEVYDLAGRKVASIVHAFMEAGEHTTSWNAGEIASGVYICRLRAGRNSTARQLTLVK